MVDRTDTEVQQRAAELAPNRYKITPTDGAAGNWVEGQRGDGVFRCTDIRVRQAAAAGGNVPEYVDISYRNGFIVLKPFVVDIGGLKGEVKIEYDVSRSTGIKGRSAADFRSADARYAEELNASGIQKPNGGPWKTGDVRRLREEKGLTWHHVEDMETMQLVPGPLNSPVPKHIGGRTLKDRTFDPPLPRTLPPKSSTQSQH